MALASSLELTTIARGIDDEQAADTLAGMGWDMGQGSLYGMAAPLDLLPSGGIARVRVAEPGPHSGMAEGGIATEQRHPTMTGEGMVDVLDTSDARYRLLAENASDAVYTLTPDGVFTYVSPPVRDLLGYAPDEIVGLTPGQLIHPDDLPLLLDAMDKVSSGNRASFRARYRDARGEFRWLGVTARPHLDAGGNLIGRVGSWRDAQAEVEADLKNSLLLENMTDVILHVVDGVIVWASPSLEEQLGWSPNDAIGTVFLDVPILEDMPVLERMIAETEFGGVASGRIRANAKNGTLHWLAARMRPYMDASGNVNGRLTSFRIIDDDVASEREIILRQELFAAAIESEIDAHLFLGLSLNMQGSTDFVITEANKVATAFFGRHLIGKYLVADEIMNSPDAMAEFYRVLETGESIRAESVGYDHPHLGPSHLADFTATRTPGGISVVWRDVTHARRAEEEFAKSEERFRPLAENSTDVVLHITEDVIEWASPSLERTLGWKPESWRGKNLDEIFHPDDLDCVRGAVGSSAVGQVATCEARMCSALAANHWMSVRTGPYLDKSGLPSGVVMGLHVIDEQVAHRSELERRARYDDLTDSLNRRALLTLLDETGKGQRDSDALSAVLFGDLDHFKSVNDRYGHAGGDEVLRTIANRIRSCIRLQDVLARVGGDEFVVVLTGVGTMSTAMTVAENLRQAGEAPVPFNDHDIPITLSIGVCMAYAGEDSEAFMSRADEAMYAAKSEGRNRVVSMF